MREPTNGAATRWLSQPAVAEYVGCSVRTIQILTKQERLPVSYALGPRSPRYDRLAIDATMMQLEKNGAATNKT